MRALHIVTGMTLGLTIVNYVLILVLVSHMR